MLIRDIDIDKGIFQNIDKDLPYRTPLLQTDCRRGAKNTNRNCIVNAGNEMQVRIRYSSEAQCFNYFNDFRAWQASNIFLLSPLGLITQILRLILPPLLINQPLLLATPVGVKPMETSLSPHPPPSGSFLCLYTYTGGA